MDSNEVKKSMAIAIAGGITISFAPILYILSEANPLTGAFFRMFYALPFLGFLIWFRGSLDSRSVNTRLIAVAAGTVSYTHLRAHETRHDLVCRLLLEKKK